MCYLQSFYGRIAGIKRVKKGLDGFACLAVSASLGDKREEIGVTCSKRRFVGKGPFFLLKIDIKRQVGLFTLGRGNEM